MTNETELAKKQVDEQEADQPAESEGKEGDSEKEEVPENAPLSWFIQSNRSLEIINKRWVSFSFLTFLIYAFHLVMAIWAVNAFTDTRVNRPCADNQDPTTFQTALALSAIWHMIEWNRQALHFFSALVEVNMIWIYYAVSVINVPLGFIVCFLSLGVRFSKAGKACNTGVAHAYTVNGVQQTEVLGQDSRGLFLSLHILFLILYILTCFHHLLIFKIMGPKWCKEVFEEEEEEDDD